MRRTAPEEHFIVCNRCGAEEKGDRFEMGGLYLKGELERIKGDPPGWSTGVACCLAHGLSVCNECQPQEATNVSE